MTSSNVIQRIRIMRTLKSFVAAAMMLASPVAAGEQPVVVELFTSQGCSSCPPADAFLHDLAARDDVLALALHVDYWDYIGWKDIFANPAYSQRQREYARAGGRRMVYTPQLVINGEDHVVGNRPMDVTDVIARHLSGEDTVVLTAARTDDNVSISAEALIAIDRPLIVQLVRYRPESTVEIKRGENAGRTLSYANVVTELTKIGEWNPAQPLSIDVPVSGDLPAVVLIQHYEHGPMEAAVKVD